MGKQQGGGGREEVQQGNVEGGGGGCCCLRACRRSTACKIIYVVLGLHLLAFSLLSLLYTSIGRNPKHPLMDSPLLPQAQIQGSFLLGSPISKVNASLLKLTSELQEEISVPNTQVTIQLLQPFQFSNWTEVVFGVEPEPLSSPIPPADLDLLKELFVRLFLQQSVNLSFSFDTFGMTYGFEILAFPGGITVVPKQPGFPLPALVLFNFTLYGGSISRVYSNLSEFKRQLSNGIGLNKANENLFVQLTNVAGSTVNSPIIVHTSITSMDGTMLASSRLKQLAQLLTISFPSGDLGLNRTFFGQVSEINLSSYLHDALNSDQGGEAVVPSSSPAPSPYLPHCLNHKRNCQPPMKDASPSEAPSSANGHHYLAPSWAPSSTPPEANAPKGLIPNTMGPVSAIPLVSSSSMSRCLMWNIMVSLSLLIAFVYI